MPRYARAGIGETWLIDLDACRVEVYREPSPDGYREMRIVLPGETITAAAFDHIVGR